MSTPEAPEKQAPTKRDDDGKPTIEQGTHDKNVGQREGTKAHERHGDGKPTIDDNNRGRNYGQREGSTISEDNDVE